MITHQSPIPWIINKWNHVLSSRVLKLLTKKVLSLDTISISYLILVQGSRDIFQHLKNHNQAMNVKPQQKLNIKIKY